MGRDLPALAAIDLRAVSEIVIDGSEMSLHITGSIRPYLLKAQASSEAKAWKRAIKRRKRQIWAAEWKNVDS